MPLAAAAAYGNDLFQAEPSNDLLGRLVCELSCDLQVWKPSSMSRAEGACMGANNSGCRPILFVYTRQYLGQGPHGCSFGGRPHGIFFHEEGVRARACMITALQVGMTAAGVKNN